jgi:hypothetical protein
MADNKEDKPGGEHPSINDSGELLLSLFREELNAIAAEKKKIMAAQTGDKSTAPKTAKSPAQNKGAGRKKAGPKTGTENKRIVKNYPVFEDQVEKPGKVASDTDTSLDKEAGEKTAPQIKGDTPEEGIKTKELEGGDVRLGGNLPLASEKLKVALLSVLLVAAVAFMLGSLGVVDFGQLLGLSEPAKRASNKTDVGKRPIAKKSTRVAARSTQKTTNNKASEKAPAPKRKRIVGDPSEAALSKARRRTMNRRAKPVTSTQEPTTVQGHPKPSASTQEPVEPTQEPLVAKKPPEPSAQRVQPVLAKAASSSVEQAPEKAAPARGDVFPGERDLSYPYSIYLGSYKSLERAERAISEYREKGLSPYWVKIDLGEKGVWYRVFSGYFQRREQANEFIKQKQIAGSESRHTIEEEKGRLSKLGYCPYVIPRGNGEALLCVGAFYQKARAQRQHAELASKGIHSEIVER